MRCFLAVPLAEPGLAAAQRIQGELRERVAEVRWARPETLHLTVHFFGAIDDARAAMALEAMHSGRAADAALRCRCSDRLGSFPARGTPRVLWLGPATRDRASSRRSRSSAATRLRAAGFEVEAPRVSRALHARQAAPPWSDDARAAWETAVAAAAGQTEIRFTAQRLVLFESRPAPGGAVYTERSVAAARSGLTTSVSASADRRPRCRWRSARSPRRRRDGEGDPAARVRRAPQPRSIPASTSK